MLSSYTVAKHIVFLHKHFPFGGAERVTLDIANELCVHGYEATVLASHHHAEAYPAGLSRRFSVVELPKGNIKWSPRVARFVRDFVKQHAVEAFVSYRELLYAPWLKRKTGAAFVFALQSMPFYEMSHASWIARRFYLNKYHRVIRAADAYGVLCEAHRQKLISTLGLDSEQQKLCVLPNSVRSSSAVERQKLPEVLFVGRLSRRDKRVDRLLRIWAEAEPQLPEWTLRVVGDGPERQFLQDLASELHLQRVCFEGFHTDVRPYYSSASILCLTSSFEGWPMSVAEGQAEGVIPIVFDSFAGAHDQISSPDEGILVPPFDEAAYARQLVALARDGARLRRMQLAVMAKAATYTIERTWQAWQQMLNRLQQSSAKLRS